MRASIIRKEKKNDEGCYDYGDGDGDGVISASSGGSICSGDKEVLDVSTGTSSSSSGKHTRGAMTCMEMLEDAYTIHKDKILQLQKQQKRQNQEQRHNNSGQGIIEDVINNIQKKIVFHADQQAKILFDIMTHTSLTSTTANPTTSDSMSNGDAATVGVPLCESTEAAGSNRNSNMDSHSDDIDISSSSHGSGSGSSIEDLTIRTTAKHTAASRVLHALDTMRDLIDMNVPSNKAYIHHKRGIVFGALSQLDQQLESWENSLEKEMVAVSEFGAAMSTFASEDSADFPGFAMAYVKSVLRLATAYRRLHRLEDAYEWAKLALMNTKLLYERSSTEERLMSQQLLDAHAVCRDVCADMNRWDEYAQHIAEIHSISSMYLVRK